MKQGLVRIYQTNVARSLRDKFMMLSGGATRGHYQRGQVFSSMEHFTFDIYTTKLVENQRSSGPNQKSRGADEKMCILRFFGVEKGI